MFKSNQPLIAAPNIRIIIRGPGDLSQRLPGQRDAYTESATIGTASRFGAAFQRDVCVSP